MDIPIEQDMDKKKELKTELFNIRTIDLSSSAKNIAEKILWASIAILGTIWIGSIGMSQMNFWNDNPVLVTKGARSLSDLKLMLYLLMDYFPSSSFCSSINLVNE